MRISDWSSDVCSSDLIDNAYWSGKHWKSLVQNYRQAPHFEEVAMWLEPLYLNNTYSKLSELNRLFLVAICAYLDIGTTISSSADYNLVRSEERRVGKECVCRCRSRWSL